MNSHSTGAAFASADAVQSLAFTQGQHTTEIANIKDSYKRLEDKLDKLFYWILGTLGAALVGVFVSLFRH